MPPWVGRRLNQLSHILYIKAPNWEYGGVFGGTTSVLTLPLNPDIYRFYLYNLLLSVNYTWSLDQPKLVN